MKRNKEGFTLIELLAVIVILAIIALIAVPVVMNIITKARKSASADTAYSVLNSAELYYAEQLLDNPTGTFVAITIKFDDTGAYYETTETEDDEGTTKTVRHELNSNVGFEIKGTRPTSGSIELSATGVATLSTGGLVINGYTCTIKTGTTDIIECK